MTLLFASCAAAAAVLVVLVIHGNALDARADEEIYLNKVAEKIMASEQPVLATKMILLARAFGSISVFINLRRR